MVIVKVKKIGADHRKGPYYYYFYYYYSYYHYYY